MIPGATHPTHQKCNLREASHTPTLLWLPLATTHDPALSPWDTKKVNVGKMTTCHGNLEESFSSREVATGATSEVSTCGHQSRTETANLRTKILDSRGSDSGRILILRGGILMSTGNSPESLNQAILAGRILVGRLGEAGGRAPPHLLDDAVQREAPEHRPRHAGAPLPPKGAHSFAMPYPPLKCGVDLPKAEKVLGCLPPRTWVG